MGRRKLRVRNYWQPKDSDQWRDGKSDGFTEDEFKIAIENQEAILKTFDA